MGTVVDLAVQRCVWKVFCVLSLLCAAVTSLCTDGYYGVPCQACPAKCDPQECNKQTGNCNACVQGYWGPQCYTWCSFTNSKCLECDQSTGTCTSCYSNLAPPSCTVCIDGYYGDPCQACPAKCDPQECNKQTGNCNACVQGYWGPQCYTWCSSTNSKCLECDQSTGTCTSCYSNLAPPSCTGCNPGYYGTNCDLPCSTACQNTACNKNTGTCSPCSPGSWGERCNATCPVNCLNRRCHQYTGECLACPGKFALPTCTGCVAGKYGPNCDNDCQATCENYQCDQISGLCDACQAGQWGEDCTKPCLPRHCWNNRCEQSSGECSGRCDVNFALPACKDCSAGFYGPDCTLDCLSPNCANNQCDRQTGLCSGCTGNYLPPNCTACKSQYYTTSCDQTCPYPGCDSKICDQQTGNCAACVGNFLPPTCNECKEFSFGEDCTSRCGHCINGTSCNSTDGSCERGCADGFAGPQCLQQTVLSIDNSAVIGGSVGGVLLLISVAVLLAFVIIRWKRRKKVPQEKRMTTGKSRVRSKRAETQEVLLTSVATPHADAPPKKSKPQVAVKPTFLRGANVKKDDDVEGHVYINVTLSSHGVNGGTPDIEDQSHTAGDSLNTRLDNGGSSHDALSRSSRAAAAQSGIRQSSSVATNLPADFAEELAEDAGNVYYNDDAVYSTFLDTSPRVDKVQQYLVDRLASGELVSEFQNIPTNSGTPQAAGNLKANYIKNRFASILPYDCNRVLLKDKYTKFGATDYVNASTIQGFNSERVYIAAQGPRDNTVVDFWRMLWQEQITHTIMLTNVKELGKDKCYEYWPGKGKSVTHGPITITSQDTESRANFDIRPFTMKRTGSRDERGVVQYHYVTWPDHGAPSTTALVSFWHFVRSKTRDAPSVPILIHCSAGVGRTGTFIGLDIAMDKVTREGRINMKEFVAELRQQRCYMVQASEQYVFLHKALLEAYTARDCLLTFDSFSSVFRQPVSARRENAKIDREFQTLTQMRSLMPKQTHAVSEDPENAAKNRYPDLLPPDGHLAFLAEHVRGRNQYINAVSLSTVRDLRGCILTQLPLPDTVVDLWRLVWGNSVSCIISLASKNEDKKIKPYCWYWPRDKGGTMKVGPYTLTLEDSTRTGDHVTSYTLKLDKEGVTSGSHGVRVLRYEDWTEEVPANTSDLLHMVQALDNTESGGKDNTHSGGKGTTKSGGKGQPVIIQCSDGVSKSGLFSVICDVMHRLTYDHEIDVYMTVRGVQCVRPEAVASEVQYRYIYEVVQQRIRDMSVYANT